MPRSPRPTDADVPEGWYMLRDGTSRIGDKYWSYLKRCWMPVTSRQTFSQNSVGDSMTCFIRRVDKQTTADPLGRLSNKQKED